MLTSSDIKAWFKFLFYEQQCLECKFCICSLSYFGDEYSSLENSLKAMEKNAEYEGQPEILALVHVIERPITVHYEDSDKGNIFGEFFTDRPGIDILYYPEERDDKGKLI